MKHSNAKDRSAFTLIELLLAMAIGVLLLGAVYVALDVQLKLAQAGREVVEDSTLARALLRRISDDITSSLTLSDPGRFRRAAQGSSSGTTSGGTSTSGSTTDPTSTDGSTEASDSEAGQSTLPVNLIFPLGVKGDATQMHLFTSRLPREAFRGINENQKPFSDLRRISYWLAGDPDAPVGLAREEVQLATTDAAINLVLPGVEDEGNFIIAPEVTEVTFSYFDGTEWLESWDSTAPGADGVTPMGPPRAIAILLGVIVRRDETGEMVANAPRHYRHVVAIMTANGPAPETSDPTLVP